MKTLMEAIKELHDLGLSQEAISEVAGVSQMTISRWSKKNPRLVNLEALDRMNKRVADIQKRRIK